MLRWTPQGGAEVRLIGPLVGWPREPGGPPTTVHGASVDGEPLSLDGAWVSKVSSLGEAFIAVRSSTLLLGDHVREGDPWSRLVIRTSNLHEWLPETGIDAD